MRHFGTFAFLALVAFSAQGTVETGGYIFLYARLLGCGETTYLIDYTEVPDNGKITVLDGIEISVSGLTEDDIRQRLAEEIGARTGHTPKSLSVRYMPNSDLQGIAREMMKLSSFRPVCSHREDHDSPPPDPGYVQSLASALPNKLPVSDESDLGQLERCYSRGQA